MSGPFFSQEVCVGMQIGTSSFQALHSPNDAGQAAIMIQHLAERPMNAGAKPGHDGKQLRLIWNRMKKPADAG